VRQTLRRASVYRWVGPGLGRWHAWLLKHVQSRVLNITEKREERAEHRG